MGMASKRFFAVGAGGESIETMKPCSYRPRQARKIVIFSGGSKADSYKSILGNSYGLWIATEINEHFDSEDSRTSFVKVALGRQLAAKKAMVLWDLNPCNPKHRIYADYIDKYQESGLPGAISTNYSQYTITCQSHPNV